VPIVTTWIEGAGAAAERVPAVDWVGGSADTLGRWAHVVGGGPAS
jgi:hypothetical protein